MDWEARVVSALAEAAGHYRRSAEGVRAAALAIWLAMDACPIRDVYRSFIEVDLVKEANELPQSSLFSGFPTTAGSASEQRRLLRALAVRLRALEMELLELSAHSPPRAYAAPVSAGGEAAYLIPHAARNRRPQNSDSFRRRGFATVRVIPTKIDDLSVALRFVEDPAGLARAAAGSGFRVGAGLFEDFALDLKTEGDAFLVTGIRARDPDEAIRRHVAEAASSESAALVFPELTVDEDRLAGLREGLSSGQLPSWPVSVFVAGSYHRIEEDGKAYNLCTVLDLIGGEVAQHRKLFPFCEPGFVEAIEPGKVLNVVVLEDALVAIGTCLDFCNRAQETPYLMLDVDYVLVPSCGADSTMEAHIERSKDTEFNIKSRTLVAQQFYQDPLKRKDPPLGYVLARLDRGRIDRASTETKSPWNSETL